MKLAAIPDHCIPDGCKRYTIAPAPGDEDHVAPVEAVAGIIDQHVRMSVLVELEEGDLERLTQVGALWLTFITDVDYSTDLRDAPLGHRREQVAVTIADARDWPDQEAPDDAAS